LVHTCTVVIIVDSIDIADVVVVVVVHACWIVCSSKGGVVIVPLLLQIYCC